jgi:tetratricopeptide (TPR) repeat protein
MNRSARRKVLITTFIIGLILKKAGIGLSILLTFPATILLGIELIRSSISKNHNSKFQILLSTTFSIFFLIVLAQLQYWIPPLRLSLVFWLCWIIFSVVYFWRGKYGWSQITLWIIVSTLLSSAAFMSPRQYHNFYKASYYEDFIRRKYTELNSDVADMYIDRYKDKSPDKERANELYLLAKIAQKEKDNPKALKLYNQSLDLYPDAALVYHSRGYFKLTRLELNSDVAYNAVKDFNRAIKLDPELADAYFHRALAISYVGRHWRACNDYTKAKALNPKLNVEEGVRRNCYYFN